MQMPDNLSGGGAVVVEEVVIGCADGVEYGFGDACELPSHRGDDVGRAMLESIHMHFGDDEGMAVT